MVHVKKHLTQCLACERAQYLLWLMENLTETENISKYRTWDMAKCAAKNMLHWRLGSAFEDGKGVSRSREIRGKSLPWYLETSSGHTPISMKLNPGARLQGSLCPRRLKLTHVRRAVSETAVTFYSLMIFKLKTQCTLTGLYRNNPCWIYPAQNPHSQFIR